MIGKHLRRPKRPASPTVGSSTSTASGPDARTTAGEMAQDFPCIVEGIGRPRASMSLQLRRSERRRAPSVVRVCSIDSERLARCYFRRQDLRGDMVRRITHHGHVEFSFFRVCHFRRTGSKRETRLGAIMTRQPRPFCFPRQLYGSN